MEPWAVQFVFEPISLSSNPWILEPVIKLTAPWGACLYPQTGPSPPALRSTLAPQMGIDGRDRGTPGCGSAKHFTGLRRTPEGHEQSVFRRWGDTAHRRDVSPTAWKQGASVGPSPGCGVVQSVRFLFTGPGTAQQGG